jgi:hypothetical protein
MKPEIADRLCAKATTISDDGDVELRTLLLEASGFIAQQKEYSDHMRHQIANRLPGDTTGRCDTWSSTLAAISRLKRERNDAYQEAERLNARDRRWHAAYAKLGEGEIVVDNGDLVGLCAPNDSMLEFDAIAGDSPAQAVAEIEARAVESILDDLRRDMPATNTASQIFKRMQLRVDVIRHNGSIQSRTAAGEKSGRAEKT